MFVQNVGLETWTSLSTGVAITPADLDGDSFNESFTASIDLGTAYDPDELAIIYPVAERMGESVDGTWEIRPLTVSMSGTVLSVTGSLARLTKPTLQFEYGADVLDYGDSPWVTTIDVYRHWYDTSDQGLGIWKTPVSQQPSLTVQTALPVVNPSNQEAGIVEVAFQYESTPYYSTPDRLQLNYSAGVPRVKRRMASGWNTAVAYLAISMMTSRKSGCERSNRIIEYWRRVPSAGEGDVRPVTVEEINHLWGPTRGARWAREFVEREALDGLTL
jgi:hypothetical protein